VGALPVFIYTRIRAKKIKNRTLPPESVGL